LRSSERYLAEQDPEELPGRGAWVYRRKQVGVRLLRRLFELKCKPEALPQTPGAFAFGLRLMAIDGTYEDVADTKANAKYFGRRCSGETQSPFSSVCMRCIWCKWEPIALLISWSLLAPPLSNVLAKGLLRSMESGMLILMDRGFVGACYLQALVDRGGSFSGPFAPQELYAQGKDSLGRQVCGHLVAQRVSGFEEALESARDRVHHPRADSGSSGTGDSLAYEQWQLATPIPIFAKSIGL